MIDIENRESEEEIGTLGPMKNFHCKNLIKLRESKRHMWVRFRTESPDAVMLKMWYLITVTGIHIPTALKESLH